MLLKNLIELQQEIDSKNFQGLKESNPPFYWSLAISGELGELKNALKKLLRNKPEDHKAINLIKDACGDTLIYLIITAEVFNIPLREMPDVPVPSLNLTDFIEHIHHQLTHLDHNIHIQIRFGGDNISTAHLAANLIDLILVLKSIASYFSFDLYETTHMIQQHNINRFA